MILKTKGLCAMLWGMSMDREEKPGRIEESKKRRVTSRGMENNEMLMRPRSQREP